MDNIFDFTFFFYLQCTASHLSFYQPAEINATPFYLATLFFLLNLLSVATSKPYLNNSKRLWAL